MTPATDRKSRIPLQKAVRIDSSAPPLHDPRPFNPEPPMPTHRLALVLVAVLAAPAAAPAGPIEFNYTTSGNTITGSCQADLLVALNSSQSALGTQSSSVKARKAPLARRAPALRAAAGPERR